MAPEQPFPHASHTDGSRDSVADVQQKSTTKIGARLLLPPPPPPPLLLLLLLPPPPPPFFTAAAYSAYLAQGVSAPWSWWQCSSKRKGAYSAAR